MRRRFYYDLDAGRAVGPDDKTAPQKAVLHCGEVLDWEVAMRFDGLQPDLSHLADWRVSIALEGRIFAPVWTTKDFVVDSSGAATGVIHVFAELDGQTFMAALGGGVQKRAVFELLGRNADRYTKVHVWIPVTLHEVIDCQEETEV